jgi:hypothetical protein
MTNPLDPNSVLPSSLLGACITFAVGGATLYFPPLQTQSHCSMKTKI